MALNVPNQITLSRLVLAVVFFAVLSQFDARDASTLLLDACVLLFVVTAATDFLDGYLARKWGQVTALGRVLDPMVDKVLICGTFILLAGPNFTTGDGESITRVAPWMVVVIVGRELLVTGLRGFNESVGRAFPASIHGKLKMWVQSVAAPVIMFIVAHEQSWELGDAGGTVKSVLAWATVIVTALSTIHYLVRSKYILEESG
ncbi:MAG: CDP-diacylglycerol--glycerol-3-phosphate 3-phosphatidyltransferase [Phycisphaerales bacterium]|nr:MAG: CDP-diacylglycerol--glycerol-3-phosphate 3-phosphatidyltransferase [Phycisphaerales bacterium]